MVHFVRAGLYQCRHLLTHIYAGARFFTFMRIVMNILGCSHANSLMCSHHGHEDQQEVSGLDQPEIIASSSCPSKPKLHAVGSSVAPRVGEFPSPGSLGAAVIPVVSSSRWCGECLTLKNVVW